MHAACMHEHTPGPARSRDLVYLPPVNTYRVPSSFLSW